MYRTSVCCDSIIVIIYLTQDHSRNFTGKDLVHVFRKLEVEGLINHSLFTCAICDVSGSFSLMFFTLDLCIKSIANLELELLLLFMQESIIPISILLTRYDNLALISCT